MYLCVSELAPTDIVEIPEEFESVIAYDGPDVSKSGLSLRPLLQACWERGATVVVLDMGEVVFIDSLGISALISEQRRRPPGTRIVVAGLCDYVRDVFEITQLFQVFDVFLTADAATATHAA